MNFKNISSYFQFSKPQRIAVLALFVIIVVLQLGFYFLELPKVLQENELEKQKWISLQYKFDSLKVVKSKNIDKIYPFNPNFITDYKGYKLGMSVQEIDRLLEYRKENKFVNSIQEFQSITQVSDSLLDNISPLFKFPAWIKNNKEYKDFDIDNFEAFKKKEKTEKLDINTASQEDLIKVFGVGEIISSRILNYRENLGGFVSMEQMKDVWGLSEEVINNMSKHFKIETIAKLKKIDINNASVKELSLFPYFKYPLATNIVIFRSMNGDYKVMEDLIKAKDFPIEKKSVIASYIEFK